MQLVVHNRAMHLRWARHFTSLVLACVLALSFTPSVAFAEAGNWLQAGQGFGQADSEAALNDEPGLGDGSGLQSAQVHDGELAVVYDSYANEAFVEEAPSSPSVPESIALDSWGGWVQATDGVVHESLDAAAFDPSLYGGAVDRATAVNAVREKMVERQQVVMVAVSDKVGAQDRIARDIVEGAYAEPGLSGEAGDYLYWHVRAWTSSVVHAPNGATFYVKFEFSYNSTAEQEEYVSSEVLRIRDSLGLDRLSKAAKLAAIHDWVALNVAYDYDHQPDSTYRVQYTAYGALHDRTAVCQGYATLFYRLCFESGLRCRVISGQGVTATGSDAHGWNIVEVGGKWFGVDSTWDSNLSEGSSETCRDYFLKVGDDFAGHEADDRYTTEEFTAAYPMADASFDATLEVTATCSSVVESVGDTAIFTASVGAEGASYRWQQSADGIQWDDACDSNGNPGRSGQLAMQCTSDNVDYQFRCEVEAPDGRYGCSDPVGFLFGLYAEAFPAVVVGYGDEGTFCVNVRGIDAGKAVCRWQQSDDGDVWANCSDAPERADSTALRVPFNASTRQRQYRCVLACDESGRTLTTSPVGFELSDFVVNASSMPVLGYGCPTSLVATTSADVVEGAVSSYVWQWSRDGSRWEDVAPSFAGRQTARLEVPGSWVRAGYLYRCVANALDGRTATSAAVAAQFRDVPVHVSSTQVEAYGDTASFTASMLLDIKDETPLRYRWQQSDDGVSWADCPSSQPGRLSRTMNVEFSEGSCARLFRCMVITSDGRYALTGGTGFSLARVTARVTGPEKSVAPGETATFTCAVTGAPSRTLTYQWLAYDPGDETWKNADGEVEGNTFTCEVQDATYETAFCCRVFSEDGRSCMTNALYVAKPEAAPISLSISTNAVAIGEMAEFVCVVDGDRTADLQARFAKEVDEDVKRTEFVFETNDSRDGWQPCPNNSDDPDKLRVRLTEDGIQTEYRCRYTDSSGNETVSNPFSPEVSGIVALVSTEEVRLGQMAIVRCSVSGDGAGSCTYQWQDSEDAINWSDMGAETSSLLTLAATPATMKKQYRCTILRNGEVVTASESIALAVDANVPEMLYKSHVADVGWQSYVANGARSGTTGRGLRLEALKMKLANPDGSSAIAYRAHVQDAGWQGWVHSGGSSYAGTVGKSLQVEALKMKLEGEYAQLYDVYYRVHVGSIGWLGWAKNGEMAGSEGLSSRVEAVQVRLVVKGEAFDVGGYHAIGDPSLTYQAHVGDVGWQPMVRADAIAGTTGQSKHIEALRAKLSWRDGPGGTIYIRSHVSGTGWQPNYAASGGISGTTGQSRPIECVVIELGGAISKYYDVVYRVHVQDIGWMGWTKNNGWAGTTGGSKAIEAIQIKLLKKSETSRFDMGSASAYRSL